MEFSKLSLYPSWKVEVSYTEYKKETRLNIIRIYKPDKSFNYVLLTGNFF